MRRSILKPPPLKLGSTLGVIATSSPVTVPKAWIDRARRHFKSLGFSLRFAPNCFSQTGYTAGTIKERVAAIHRFIADSSIDGLVSFWGGNQTHQLLEYLDYKLIIEFPKVILGYSDLTALQVACFAKTGLVTFSGPSLITSIPGDQIAYTWKAMQDVIGNRAIPLDIHGSSKWADCDWWKNPHIKLKHQRSKAWQVFRHGEARGRLIGGNLGTMLLLHGTPYWASLNGAILVVEEDDSESPESIDRLFTRLRHLGIFDQIRGLVIGRFSKAVRLNEKTFRNILQEVLSGYDFPVMFNLDFGHTFPTFTLPIGIRGAMNTRSRSLTLLESGVSEPRL